MHKASATDSQDIQENGRKLDYSYFFSFFVPFCTIFTSQWLFTAQNGSSRAQKMTQIYKISAQSYCFECFQLLCFECSGLLCPPNGDNG